MTEGPQLRRDQYAEDDRQRQGRREISDTEGDAQLIAQGLAERHGHDLQHPEQGGDLGKLAQDAHRRLAPIHQFPRTVVVTESDDRGRSEM